MIVGQQPPLPRLRSGGGEAGLAEPAPRRGGHRSRSVRGAWRVISVSSLSWPPRGGAEHDLGYPVGAVVGNPAAVDETVDDRFDHRHRRPRVLHYAASGSDLDGDREPEGEFPACSERLPPMVVGGFPNRFAVPGVLLPVGAFDLVHRSGAAGDSDLADVVAGGFGPIRHAAPVAWVVAGPPVYRYEWFPLPGFSRRAGRPGPVWKPARLRRPVRSCTFTRTRIWAGSHLPWEWSCAGRGRGGATALLAAPCAVFSPGRSGFWPDRSGGGRCPYSGLLRGWEVATFPARSGERVLLVGRTSRTAR